MISQIKKIIAGSKLLQFALVFLGGLILGAMFYPSKHIETKTSQKYEQQSLQLKSVQSQLQQVTQQNTQLTQQYEAKISSLTTQVQSLQSKKKKTYYKLVKPDGTVIIKADSENDTDEDSQTITQVQEQYEQKMTELQSQVTTLQQQLTSKEQDYQKQIASLTTSKVEDINEKSFGLGLGALTNSDYFLQGTANVLGPIYIGIQLQTGTSSALGGMVGLRF